MLKMKELEKEICMWVRKTRCNIAITSGEKVIGKPAGKWKSSSTIVEISENNKDKKKKRSKRKVKEWELEWTKRHDQEGENLLE